MSIKNFVSYISIDLIHASYWVQETNLIYVIVVVITCLFFYQGEIDHDTEVTCCDLYCDVNTSAMQVVSGTKDGKMIIVVSLRIDNWWDLLITVKCERKHIFLE